MSNTKAFPQPICEQIWNAKYRLITANPLIEDDQCVEDTWSRIAGACAASEPKLYGNAKLPKDFKNQEANRKAEFYNALDDHKFLPAGRITSGAGSGRAVTLFNCYVMGEIPDSLPGIFNMLKEAAITMQQGGGIGYDFSTLRPKGSPVKKVDADASGPLSFMDVWDAMCRTIMSAGSRRGAMMATMRCDHPDIEDFITAKMDSNRLRMFNVSVLATDAFMKAVENDYDWPLVHKTPPGTSSEFYTEEGSQPQMLPNGEVVFDHDTAPYIHKIVKAKDLWNSIMLSTFNQAEPGVLFIDTINKMNNLWYVEKISATNPCGEQPLPPYGACLLGSINLTKVVDNPFTDYTNINVALLQHLTKVAVRMLDSVIDISLFPLPEQKEEALKKRRMGLGITGLANMLFMCRLTYGSDESAEFVKSVMSVITIAAYEESIQLAKLYGPCPVTETLEQRREFCKSGFMKQMPKEIHDGVMDYGIRNALLTSIAPTGTISLYAGNVSSGVEPVFAKTFTRKVLEDDGVTKREERVEDYGIKLYREFLEKNDLPEDDSPKHFTTAQTLHPLEHLKMQTAVQIWIDSSISKTINCPEDISFDDFKEVYMEAWLNGCKGCTTYRPNSVTGSVLSVESEPKEEPVPVLEVEPVDHTGPIPRHKILSGQTYKLKWNDNNFYVTINNYVCESGDTIPFEIFINTQDMSQFQWTVALTRMMSSVFRRGGNVGFVVEDLKSIMDPNGGAWVEGKYVPSFIALLGLTIEQHLKDLKGVDDVYKEVVRVVENIPTTKPTQCPSCKGYNTHLASGCAVCTDCGHSKCG